MNVASAGPPQRAASRTDWQSVPPGHVGNLPHAAHYPGTPQGRRPEEAGAHGCTLVQVDRAGQARTSLTADRRGALAQRAAGDRRDDDPRETWRPCSASGMHALVETVAENGPADLVDDRRQRAAGGPVAARRTWRPSCSAGCGASTASARRPPGACRWRSSPSAAAAPQWYEQETIRGDFLRAVRQLEMNPDEPLELEPYLAEAAPGRHAGRGGGHRRIKAARAAGACAKRPCWASTC